MENRPVTRTELQPNLARARAVAQFQVGSSQAPSVGESGGEGRPGLATAGSVLGGDAEPDGPGCEGEREGALGTLTSYCPHSRKDAVFLARLERLGSSFELRSRLRPHAVCERIAICGCRVYTDPEIVTEEYEDGSRAARWTGIVLCNRAGCAACGATKARKFHDAVLRTLSMGGRWQHVTLTVPHHLGESWATVYERLMHGLRAISKGQAGKLMRELVTATIRATETTRSPRFGWHVHCHCLWRIDREQFLPTLRRNCLLTPAEVETLARDWALATGAEVDQGVTLGMALNAEHEGERRQGADYVSKIAAEMSGAGKSARSNNWTLGEVYHLAADGDAPAVQLVREYQEQTKGRRLYQLDRRAQRLHDAAPELPELRVTAKWVTPIDRLEFRALSRGERFRGEPLACYLPLEVAARCRGDPTDAVLDTIYDLAGGFEEA